METKSAWIEKKIQGRVVATIKGDYRLVPAPEIKKTLANEFYRDTTMEQVAELSRKSTLYQTVARDITRLGLSLLTQEVLATGVIAEVGLPLSQSKIVLKFLAQVIQSESITEMGRVIHHQALRTLAVHQGDLKRLESYLFARAY